jgi:hypothetical protein
MLNLTQALINIRAGMALLDSRNPGWKFKLNLETLDFKSSTDCILGQVYGAYTNGVGKLGLDWNDDADNVKIQALGFNVPAGCDWWGDCDIMTKLWKGMLTNV